MRSIRSRIALWIVKNTASLQQKLSAKHTAYYLFFEILTLGFIFTAIIYIMPYTSFFEEFFVFISFFTFSISTYIVLQARKQTNTPAVAAMTLGTVVFLIFVSSIPLLFAYAINLNLLSIVFGLLPIIVYLTILQFRNRRYLGVHEFFVNQYSDAYNEWVEASVALERAIELSDRSRYRAYYWSLRAEHSYRRVAHEDTLELREIAAEFASVASLFSASMMADTANHELYASEAYVVLSRAIEKSRGQLCDNCGRQVHIGNISSSSTDRFQNVCSNCRVSDNSSDRKTKRRTSRFNAQVGEQKKQRNRRQKSWDVWQRKAHRSRYTNTRDDKSTSRDSNDNSNDFNMSVEESMSVLDISEEPSDPDTIMAAFRDRVKDVHPDAGGSAQQFKEVKEAREVLSNNL